MPKVGILSFGGYLPKTRVKLSDIAKNSEISELGIIEKAVATDEDDTLTLAVGASEKALRASRLKSEQITAVIVGSETHIYAVKPTAGMLASFLKVNPFSHVADVEFACKSGTAALQMVYNMVKAGSVEYGLAVGADVGKGEPGDVLEYTAASGAAAFVMANSDDVVATIDDTVSFNLDTPDFWREHESEYPSHAGRFSSYCYEQAITASVERILSKNNMSMGDFQHVVFHMPNAKLPKVVASKLGVSEKQLEAGFIVPHMGNTFSANSLLGLISVLEVAEKGEKILLCSYGSGSGSDAFILTMN